MKNKIFCTVMIFATFFSVSSLKAQVKIVDLKMPIYAATTFKKGNKTTLIFLTNQGIVGLDSPDKAPYFIFKDPEKFSNASIKGHPTLAVGSFTGAPSSVQIVANIPGIVAVDVKGTQVLNVTNPEINAHPWQARGGRISVSDKNDTLVSFIESAFDTSEGFIFKLPAGLRGAVQQSQIASVEVLMDIAIGPVLAHPKKQSQIVGVSEMGQFYLFDRSDSGETFKKSNFFQTDFTEAGWSVTLGSVFSSFSDSTLKDIIVGTRYTNSVWIYTRDSMDTFRRVKVYGPKIDDVRHSWSASIWDVKADDIVSKNQGDEIVSVDTQGRVILSTFDRSAQSFNSEILWQVPQDWPSLSSFIDEPSTLLSSVLAVDFDSKRPGKEVVAAGLAGKVIYITP